MMKQTLISILFFSLCAASFAQQWTNFVPPVEVADVAVDAQGYKWVVTQGEGVYVLGGGTQIQYNTFNSDLPHNSIIAVAIDHNGIKWFGSSAGLTRFDGSTWTTYKTADGLVHNFVRDIAVDAQNNVWAATAGGISAFDGFSFTNYTSANSGFSVTAAVSVAVDGFGNKWFGTNNSGVFFFYGTGWTQYHTGNSDIPSDHVKEIAVDDQGTKWIGTSAGLSRFSPLGVWNTFPVNNGVHRVFVDSQDNVWLGTWHGAIRYDGTDMVTLDTGNSEIAADLVLAIAEEPGCGMWFGTPYGLSAYTNCLAGVAEYVTGTANVFPNPAVDLVTVTLPDAVSRPLTVSVYDYRGSLLQVHKTASINGTFTMDVAHLPAGFYVMKTESEKGVWISRIIKK